MEESNLSIGRVATLIGVRASALRFYEETGLVPPVRREGGKRHYDAETVERLRLIRFCQEVGFSLAEIRRLLSGPQGRSGKQRWREVVDGKLLEVERTIHRAEAMKKILEESPTATASPPIAAESLPMRSDHHQIVSRPQTSEPRLSMSPHPFERSRHAS